MTATTHYNAWPSALIIPVGILVCLAIALLISFWKDGKLHRDHISDRRARKLSDEYERRR